MINAVGAIFLCYKTSRLMLQMRSNKVSHPKTWAFWGGKVEKNELPINALNRELQEEMGILPPIKKIYPLHVFVSKNKFDYNTFIVTVKKEFVPRLNEESSGYCWVDINNWPKPLHSGAKLVFYDTSCIKKIQTILKNY